MSLSKNRDITMRVQPLYLHIDDASKMAFNFPGIFDRKIRNSSRESEIVYAFLEQRKSSFHTYNSYSKSLETFLLFCIHVTNIKSFSQLSDFHIVNYIKFLSNPQPTEQWCGERKPRKNINWRPFTEPMQQKHINRQLVLLGSFLKYLFEIRCINLPLSLPKINKSQIITERFIERQDIKFVLDHLDKIVNENEFKIKRLKFIILLFFYTGLRISEAVNHTVSSFIKKDDVFFCA